MDKSNQFNSLGGIVKPLLDWYGQNARILPWRENTDPYRVWVSEIMLQQTRVETVIPYYNRFITALPDIKALAEANEQILLKLWEGLGYYSRVRNLQKAAQKIMTEFNGQFPDEFNDILSLPGIGTYTAGAISSICFEKPVPAVDGNVLRVLSRLLGSEADIALPEVKAEFTELLRQIYPKNHCGDFTQSLMELGAIICLPNGMPNCMLCPLAALCEANRSGRQAELPIKSKKTPRKKEQMTVFLLLCGDKIALQKRPQGVLLGGLWEFPNAPGHLTAEQAKGILAQWKIAAASISEGPRKKHIFTHIEWEMTSYLVSCETTPEIFTWVTREQLTKDLALPSAFQGYLNSI
ncbi:MAG TPA: A/G-specific adenine glycosylase [Oscillospiraceae bacterium]|nr:A/G-specific adenine glycosylase [Oscillospiraceae bacterium]HPF56015.1 A/G-specific adenine glycosylase [Clostridiales bacterium]HPK35496.1 A/G-specific adenine glycosylase [Oscillospiraceae bacterium]HPR76034.1 A/G-specific adenine glycosylase [Oscillospiraceae bacterium]